jgi:DNA-binding NtrC family response regulator
VVRGPPRPRTLLLRHDWPGNVRELSNALERAVVLGADHVIGVGDLPESLAERGAEDAAATGFHAQVAAARREIIRQALDRTQGNVAAAARELDLQVTYLHRLIRNLNVRGAAE